MKQVNKVLKAIRIIGIFMITAIFMLTIYNQIALKMEKNKIIPNGQLIDVGGYKVHVYSEGNRSERPVLVFLSGSATVAPTYDFKPLYSLLSNEYRIAVVEKAGYGYSDIIEVNRNVDSMVNEVRYALIGADVPGPYILLPHSMSGLEALYWAQNYPKEVVGIIGLDMAVPYSYDYFDFNKINQMEFIGGTAAKLGFLRIPGIYPLHTSGLSKDEKSQQQLLMHRNAVNNVYILEGKAVYQNAQIVKKGTSTSCSILLFSSNGTEIGDFWLSSQEKFAEENNAKLIVFDSGHYLHYFRSKEMASEIKVFIEALYKD